MYLLNRRIWMDIGFSLKLLSSTSSLQLYCSFIGMTLLFKTFILWSIIPTGYTSNNKLSLSSAGGASKTWEGSDIYFLNIETRKTLWMHSKFHGNSPILSRIQKALMYRMFSFPYFWNRITFFQGTTLRNTMYPISNSKAHLRVFT